MLQSLSPAFVVGVVAGEVHGKDCISTGGKGVSESFPI